MAAPKKAPAKKPVAKAPVARKPVEVIKAAPKKVVSKAKPTARAAVKSVTKAVNTKKNGATKKK